MGFIAADPGKARMCCCAALPVSTLSLVSTWSWNQGCWKLLSSLMHPTTSSDCDLHFSKMIYNTVNNSEAQRYHASLKKTLKFSNNTEVFFFFFSQQYLTMPSKAPCNAHGNPSEGLAIPYFLLGLLCGCFHAALSAWEPMTHPCPCGEESKWLSQVLCGHPSSRINLFPSSKTPKLQAGPKSCLAGKREGSYQLQHRWVSSNYVSWSWVVILWKPYTDICQQKTILNIWKPIQLFKLRENADLPKYILRYFI